MCGRMTLTRSGDEIADYFAEAVACSAGSPRDRAVSGVPQEPDGSPLRRRFNLAPSQDALTLVPAPLGSGVVAAFAWKRWGLVPGWAKDPSIGARMFNARSETADTKPSFRAAWKRRRCLVAADGFYEWTPRNRGHQPFLFRPRRGALLAFAGLFEEWRGEGGECIESCTVLTTEANADLEGVHHRMPVILPPDQLAEWLEPSTPLDALKELVVSAPSGTLERTPVDRYVNDPRHDDERCLAPPARAATKAATKAAAKAGVRAEQVDLFSVSGEAAGEVTAGEATDAAFRDEPMVEEF